MRLLFSFFGISILSFILIRLVPGDPVLLMLGERGGTPEARQELRAKLGLDKPLFQQYQKYMLNIAKGDFGKSFVSKEPVLKEFFLRFAATLELTFLSMFMAFFLALIMGIIAARYHGSVIDRIIVGEAVLFYSIPIFWWGLLAILFFSVFLEWTPVAGRIGVAYDIDVITGFFLVDAWWSEEPWEAFKSVLHHLILPSVVLGTVPLALLTRIIRSSFLEVLKQDYIRTAWAKGLSKNTILFKHALKNSFIPIMTVLGLIVGALLGGAVLTETIFSWPGIGKWMVESIEARDYPVIQGGVLLIAVFVISVNLLVDRLYSWVNPQVSVKKRGW